MDRIIYAEKEGRRGRFSATVWNTGIPRKNGWIPVSEEAQGPRVIPKEVVELSEQRKAQVDEKKARAGVGAADAVSADKPAEPAPEIVEPVMEGPQEQPADEPSPAIQPPAAQAPKPKPKPRHRPKPKAPKSPAKKAQP